MNQFKIGAIRILISTDILGRGIDVLSLNIVINYDMPRGDHAIESYIHRIGRALRGENKKGIAVNLASISDFKLIEGLKERNKMDIKEAVNIDDIK